MIESATFWIGARYAKRNSNSVDLKKKKFACSKISSSTSAILFASIFSQAQLVCHFDTSAVRNVCNRVGSAIVCDYMETTLFAIVCVECDLRFAIRDRLRSFAIIWKPALKHFLRTTIDDVWPLIEFTLCEKQKYQVAFVTKKLIKYLVSFAYN